MAVDLHELLALPREERIQLAETLLESTAPPDIGPLLRQLVTGLERTNRTLDLAIARMIGFDERRRRARAEVREAVLLSREQWPFPVRE